MSLPPSVQVHPTALVESSHIGERTTIWAFVHVSSGARVGSDCNLCDYVKIDTGVRIGDGVTVKEYAAIFDGAEIEDGVFVGPGVLLLNDRVPRSRRMAGSDSVRRRYSAPQNWLSPTKICRGASLGGGVVVAPGVTVGEYALIGAGAVVARDVPPFRLMVGVPARATGWVCICGLRLRSSGSKTWECHECEREYLERDVGLSLIERR